MSETIQADKWITDLGSDNPTERIIARVNILRNFPYSGDEELKRKVYFEDRL